jgi:type I restriction enzyme M protein
MRRKLIQMDLLECVLGLGPNLFYNSPMEACVVICRTQKPPSHRGKVLFIDAVHEVARERAQSFLKREHQSRIVNSYRAFADEPGFAAVVTTVEIQSKGANLSIPRYVRTGTTSSPRNDTNGDLGSRWAAFDTSGREFWLQMDVLVDLLDGVVTGDALDA